MLRSLYSGISGVKNQQAQLDVISNNIANVNTNGFKSGRMTFADALSENISGARGTAGNFGGANPVQIGRGAVISSIDTNFKQGSLDATSSLTDVAINGKGFFVVSDGQKQYYSRAGAFQIQDDGSLMAQGGSHYVMGRVADTDGNLPSSTAIDKIILPFGKKEPAKATENVTLYCNLSKNATQVEEWLGGSALTTDGKTPATGNTDLAVIEGNTIHVGDKIEITGTKKDGSKVINGNQNYTFTYGVDGTTIQDLMNKINEAFESTTADGSTMSLDQNGKLRLLANQGGENATTIFLTALSADNHSATKEVHTSEGEYLNYGIPTSTTAINDLVQVSTDYVDGDTINVTIAGQSKTFTYGAANDGTTVGDFINWVNSSSTGFPDGVNAKVDSRGAIVSDIGSVAIATAAGTGVGFASTAANTTYFGIGNLQAANGDTDLVRLYNTDATHGVSISEGKKFIIKGQNPDGYYKQCAFVYGADEDGTTINDLLTKINNTFDGVTASIDTNGQIVFKNDSSGESKTYIQIVDGTGANSTSNFTMNFTTEKFTSSDALTTGTGVAVTGATTINTTTVPPADPDGVIGVTNYAAGDVLSIIGTKTDGTSVVVDYTFPTNPDTATLQDLVDTINSGSFSGMQASIDADGKIVFTDLNLSDDFDYTSFEIVEGKHTDGSANIGSGLARTFDYDETATAGTDNSKIVLPSFSSATNGTTGKHSTSITVYDSLGDSHELEINFTQDLTPGSNKWNWDVVVDEGNTIPNAGNSGTVTFNEDGSLKAFSFNNGDKLKFKVNGTDEVSIALNPGTAGAFDGITQMSSASTTVAIDQDGYTLGVLNNINIDDQGIITGIYSNGVSKNLAQMALASFTNEGGLQKEGNSLYSANNSSGNPIVGWAGQNTKTVIKSGYLESSNVDLTDEFAKLIISQRALEANSKVIGTADTILSTIINNMKRS